MYGAIALFCGFVVCWLDCGLAWVLVAIGSVVLVVDLGLVLVAFVFDACVWLFIDCLCWLIC